MKLEGLGLLLLLAACNSHERRPSRGESHRFGRSYWGSEGERAGARQARTKLASEGVAVEDGVVSLVGTK
jgi:hypothetical protein